MPLRFADHVLLKAKEIQGDVPPGMVPVFPESDLSTAFVGTAYEASATDRGTLLKAMKELKDRGWMELIEVQGPWSWQLTGAGSDRADQLIEQQKTDKSKAEAQLRARILAAYEEQSHKGVVGGMVPPVDVTAIGNGMKASGDEYLIQAIRLRDQGFVDLKGLPVRSLSEGLGFITERGRQQLDAPAAGPAPSRTTAELYQQIAKLKRELEVAGTKPEALIRDAELKDRAAGLLVGDKNYDTAVREATVILEDRVRKKSGVSGVSGVELMTAAFKEDTGALIVSDDSSEQRGVHMTFRGIIGWVRNSFHHHVIDATAQGDAMRIIAFIDWLLEEVDRARIR